MIFRLKLQALAAAAASLSPLTAAAEGVYTRTCDDPALLQEATRWMQSGAWRNGYTAGKPNESVNAVDFYEQYRKNPAQWDALFQWLAKTDLNALPAGKTPIEGSDLVASIEDTQNGPLEERKCESHYKKIDFQFCVRGTEGFGYADKNTAKPNTDYRPDVIFYDYDRDTAKIFMSKPDEFFLFFPQDYHIPKIANNTDNQDIRVVVVKIDYVE